jgi:hypothetical protein
LGLLKRYGSIMKYSMKVMGILLIIIGLLLATSSLQRLSEWLTYIF